MYCSLIVTKQVCCSYGFRWAAVPSDPWWSKPCPQKAPWHHTTSHWGPMDFLCHPIMAGTSYHVVYLEAIIEHFTMVTNSLPVEQRSLVVYSHIELILLIVS